MMPNKLKFYITLGWKGLQVTNTQAYKPICKLRRKWESIVNATLESYSQPFFFFVTCVFMQWVRVSVIGKPFKLSIMQHSSLLGWFVSYEENEVLWTRPLQSKNDRKSVVRSFLNGNPEVFALSAFCCFSI